MTARSTSPDSATSPVLLRGDIDGIALLSLNRPQARNTLSEAMLAALQEQFASIAKDDQVRAVIISHNGPAFCAGHDMKEMTAHRADRRSRPQLFQGADGALQRTDAVRSQKLPQPVIAAVEGVATAAGCQLVATCDLAVASETARFSTPGVHIGLFCSTPMVALSRNVAQQARHGNAADRRHDLGRRRPSHRPRQSRRGRRQGVRARAGARAPDRSRNRC